ncbi:MAG: hypothetical protein M3P51_11895, partial [Chloroflexota bacterium]|nr:hypothetical protein [Chloroflexota bacterium]
MYDLRRIRCVTEHYSELQGLGVVPISLWLLGWAAYDAGLVSLPGLLGNRWVLGLTSLAVVVALTLVIQKLYNRAFGWISPDPQRQSESRAPGFWFSYLSVMAIFFLSQARPETSFTGLLIAGTAWGMWWSRREAKHWLALGIIIAGMSLAPLLDGLLGPGYPSATVRDITIKVVAAVGLLVIGTMDHLTLVRTLG